MATQAGFVAIIGRPNAGKSTLLNAVLGSELSIVTPKAQTTREKVLGILTEGEKQIIFVDTPGIHRAKEGGINAYMVAEARQALESPSVIWYLLDPNSAIEHEQAVLDLLRGAEAPIFLLVTKNDLPRVNQVEKLEQAVLAAAAEKKIKIHETRRISATKGEGLKEILEATWQLLPEGPLLYEDADQLSDRPERFFVAEKIREQLLLQLEDEIPYSCAVEIEKFDEQCKPKRIEAVIFVERDSQKGIVIGKGGARIKSIGQAARASVETFLGEHVFLGLKVKVLKDWTHRMELMKRVGYVMPKRRAS